ncbi:MAG: glycosyltransferase family 4 protein [Candidatus Zixiibacteriota bacterium]|nr:MAG: glycosyltransferase family 4 protein [candidate division Zixibacteria bacterium]
MGRDQKIRVCHVMSGDLWAGAEVQAFTLLMKLHETPELEVRAIVLNEGKLASSLRDNGLDVDVIDESKHGFRSILRHARELLQNQKTDIIHSHRRKENVLAGLLKRSGHTKYLVQTVHGAPEPFKGLNRIREKFYMGLNNYFTTRHFDHILPVSDDLKQYLGERLGRGRLTTVHNSINVDEVLPDRGSVEVKRAFGFSEGHTVIGSAGRMVAVKGFDIFLKAGRILLEKRPDVRFLLVGDGPQLEDLQKLAKELGIDGQVRFPGFRNDMTDLLNCLDVFVVSSHHEGIPTVVLEAMALKKAVVATSVGGMIEMLDADVSGILVPPSNAGAIASACERLLNDSALRERLGRAAREKVERHFSARTQAEKVVDIYRQLAGCSGEDKRRA